MTTNASTPSDRWLNYLIVAAMVGSVGMLMVALLAWQRPFGGQLQLQVRDVAPYDIVAPSEIQYESRLRTEQARERAAQAVPDQYDSSEGAIRRQQVSRAREILEFITIVRNDPYATPEVRNDYLLAIPDLNLTPEVTLHIEQLSSADWDHVLVEAPLALDRAMREEIRESSLPAVKRRVPSLISADLSEEASVVTADLVRALIRPNSIFNEARTMELREQARSNVPVQSVTLARGETIIRAGDLVTPEALEALTYVGLLQAEWDRWMLIRAVALTLVILVVVIGAIYRLRPQTLTNYQELAVLVVIAVLWLLAAKFLIIPHDWLPYLYPLAALGMLVTVLVDLRVAVVMTIGFTLIVHFLGVNNPALVTYVCAGSIIGSLALGRAERLSAFLWAGLAVAISNLLAYVAHRATFFEFETASWSISLFQNYVVALLNGGISASVALLGYFVLGNLFNFTTTLQLTELSRPTHPLLRQLLLKAPGTYHHTIVVSNLAERAAAAIGADAFLTRVGAYYHDIGKTVRPYFFTENIADGTSPHEKLDPVTSAQIIISHVPDGVDLAQKYRLPTRIQDFIREHHGRSLTQYFYTQAQRSAGKGEAVAERDFRYPGPSPRTRETAILLLADTCEAAVRSVRPATREDLERLVRKLIDERISEGELDESNLTFKELQTIREIFLQVLQGVHHPRISYPEAIKPGEQRSGLPPTTESDDTESPVSQAASGKGQTNGQEAPPRTSQPAPGGVEEEMAVAARRI
ncbi:MAG: HDIG domain-containing protein [Caldilineaceae bacterium]|nr:HDIG domain-containing protein [Caldilineaceae bacterium]